MNYNLAIIIECLFFFIFNLVIVKMILQWKHNDCLCVDTKNKDYIFYFSIFYMFFSLSFIIYPYYIKTLFGKILSLVSLPITIFYIYTLIMYIKELKEKEGCECMKKTNLVILEWYTYIFAFLLVLGYMYVCNYYMKGPEYKKILNDYLYGDRKCFIKKKNNMKYLKYQKLPKDYIIKKKIKHNRGVQ